MIHNLRLNPRSFQKIKAGNKIIETRLFDEKRKNIKIGDILIFENTETNERLDKKVEDILMAKSFEELVSFRDIAQFGYDSKIDFLNNVKSIYSEAKEKEFGVVGIVLTNID